MTLENNITEYWRAMLAVWDYPVSDKYTKILQNIRKVKEGVPAMPASLEEARVRVQASPTEKRGFALIADATDVR